MSRLHSVKRTIQENGPEKSGDHLRPDFREESFAAWKAGAASRASGARRGHPGTNFGGLPLAEPVFFLNFNVVQEIAEGLDFRRRLCKLYWCLLRLIGDHLDRAHRFWKTWGLLKHRSRALWSPRDLSFIFVRSVKDSLFLLQFCF